MSFMIAPFRFGGGGGGGGLPDDVLAYEGAPTSNVFDMTGLSFTGYQRAILYLDEITVDTANTLIILQFYISGSGLITSSTYDWSFSFEASGSTPAPGSIAGTSSIRLASYADSGSNISWNAAVHICSPATSVNKLVHHDGAFMQSDGTVVETTGSGGLANTGAIDGIKISGSSGLITGGRAMLVGLPTS